MCTENDERLLQQNNALLTLMSQGTLFQMELQQALAEITEVSAALLDTDRVSVWLYSDDYTSMRCVDLYSRRDGLHSSGEELASVAFPANTESHRRGTVITAMDVFAAPRTCDIPAAYYRDHNIRSLLDAPVWVKGRLGGILSFEQTDEQRSWIIEDETLATRMAAILSLCFEINDRRGAEEALQKSEAALKQQNEVFSVLLNNLSSGVFMVEAPSGRPIIANPAAQRLLGRGILPDASSENLAEVYRAHKPGASAPYPLEEMPIVRGMRGETAHIDDMIVKRPSGVQTRLEVFGAPIRNADGQVWASLVSFQDITERKRAEEELKSNYTLLQIAGETAHFGGWSVDLRSNTCTWSDAVADIHEVPRGYAPPIEKAIAFYAPEWHDSITRVFTACAGDGIPYDEDMEIITRKGKRVWVRTIGRAVRNEDGRIVQVQGSFQDITERKQAEAEKEKLQAQLAQAQKMESVGRLAGGVAHDFNNMLGVILGHAELALDHIGTNAQLCAHLDEIQKAARRSAELTQQLLAFARKQTVTPKVLDLNDTMEGMLKMLGRLIGENIDLLWRPGSDIGTVFVDPSQVDQILANLCVNARDAIADTGRITIETCSASFDEAWCADHPDFLPGEFAMLAVSDDGCGMDAEILSHLFEPFFTTKAVGKGTGLGLATVYGAVRQNNGFVTVCSEPGHGTTFRIYLPRHMAKPVVRPEQQPSPARSTGGETILLVEDEPIILQMTTMMLEGMGYAVIPAATPGEAMRLARECRRRIDMLMTDVIMPEMNGRDLARNLLSIYPDMGRMFMSGYTADIIAHHGVLDADVHFIQKPFSMKELGSSVRKALQKDHCEFE